MTDPTADTSRRPRLEISAAQVAGGALAAVTSAVAGSTLGVNGTLAGAAVGSVVATVGGELYTQSLRRTHDKVRDVVVRPTTAHAPTTVLPGDNEIEEMPREQQTPVLSQTSDPVSRGSTSGPPLRRLAVLGAAAAGVFALSMGVVSVGEVIAGRPVASVVTGEEGSGTTVSRTLGGGRATPADSPSEPNQSPGSEPESTPDATRTPDSSPSPTTVSRQNATPGQSDSSTPNEQTTSPAPRPSASP